MTVFSIDDIGKRAAARAIVEGAPWLAEQAATDLVDRDPQLSAWIRAELGRRQWRTHSNEFR